MKLFVISLVAACALMVAFASSALADTDGHFPEVTSPGIQNACTVLLSTPASQPGTGSDTGFGNKADLYVDACLGGA